MHPRILITMGDPAGIGPEVIAKAWCCQRVHQVCRPVVIGHPDVMRRACQVVGAAVQVTSASRVENRPSDLTHMPCLWCGDNQAARVALGRASAAGGEAAYQAVMAAVDQLQAGAADGLVTAPLSKEALHAAGHHVPGHTELLAQRCGVDRFAMALHLPPGSLPKLGPLGLTIVHVTLHVALRDIWQQLSIDQVRTKIELADRFCRRLAAAAGLSRSARIAVAALNPHAGEAGLFGGEEATILRPAIERAASGGIVATGPLPADTLIAHAFAGEFDAVVVMYHDQGHIAVKLMAMHRAVNATLGLPITRTSVAHGTAFDLAGTGMADAQGMVHAIVTCAEWVEGRVSATEASERTENSIAGRSTR